MTVPLSLAQDRDLLFGKGKIGHFQIRGHQTDESSGTVVKTGKLIESLYIINAEISNLLALFHPKKYRKRKAIIIEVVD